MDGIIYLSVAFLSVQIIGHIFQIDKLDKRIDKLTKKIYEIENKKGEK
jgi:uncharacterized coiled-coil protein SlyX